MTTGVSLEITCIGRKPLVAYLALGPDPKRQVARTEEWLRPSRKGSRSWQVTR
jgi:hypothetical protein